MWSAVIWLKHVEGERTTGKVSKHPWDVIIETFHYIAIVLIQTPERELPVTYHSPVICLPLRNHNSSRPTQYPPCGSQRTQSLTLVPQL